LVPALAGHHDDGTTRATPVRVGMDQGGWLTLESFMAYAHDVPEVRRAVVDQLPIGRKERRKESA
jgi:hypothetical protein